MKIEHYSEPLVPVVRRHEIKITLNSDGDIRSPLNLNHVPLGKIPQGIPAGASVRATSYPNYSLSPYNWKMVISITWESDS